MNDLRRRLIEEVVAVGLTEEEAESEAEEFLDSSLYEE